eukprot:GILK01008894.1.p1 GENE.GILK01008894.1~~GILK01008894.1.p1  ORF type:complete len:825 (-),score=104.84 GILK01008894.1:236-2710(-)
MTTVYSWGTNKHSQLGVDPEHVKLVHGTPMVAEPRQVDNLVLLLGSADIVDVAAGEGHTLVLTEFGDVYAWGRGKEGQLGQEIAHSAFPVARAIDAEEVPDMTSDSSDSDNADSQISSLEGGGVNLKPGWRQNQADLSIACIVPGLKHHRITKIACGSLHSVALTSSGQVYMWGLLLVVLPEDNDSRNYNGIIGMDTTGMDPRLQRIVEKSNFNYLRAGQHELKADHNPKWRKTQRRIVPSPTLALGVENERIVDVAAGYAHTLLLSTKLQLFACGYNDRGQLGVGNRINSHEFIPVVMNETVRIVQMSCGQQHNLARSDTGKVFAWGSGALGQMGIDSARDRLIPILVEPIEDRVATFVAAGFNHSVAVVDDGSIFSWGHSEYYQHGAVQTSDDSRSGFQHDLTSSRYYFVPRHMTAMKDHKVVSVVCGSHYTIATTDSGQLYSWGWNDHAQLGQGWVRFLPVPRPISAFEKKQVLKLAPGPHHCVAVVKSEDVSFGFAFRQFVDDPQTADLVLHIADRRLYLHRVLLSVRNHFFADRIARALTSHRPDIDQQPDNEASYVTPDGLIHIHVDPSTSFEAYKGLVEYLYTDHLHASATLCHELGVLAAAMDVQRLAALCENATTNGKWRKSADGNWTRDVNVPISTFRRDIASLVGTDRFADVIFEVGDQRIPAHKILLFRTSPYFRAMLSGGFREGSQACISVNANTSEDETLEPAVFRALLAYLYAADRSVVQGDSAMDLLVAASRFGIEDLKQCCESVIGSHLNRDNAELLLQFAERCDAQRLARDAVDMLNKSDAERPLQDVSMPLMNGRSHSKQETRKI